MNSPGGEVSGTEEAARLVRDLAKTKPVVALVKSIAASAAGGQRRQSDHRPEPDGRDRQHRSGSDRSETKAKEKDGVRTYEIVSSQSPKKRPDMETEEGRSQLKRAIVDSLAQVFIDSVATMRGKTAKQWKMIFG